MPSSTRPRPPRAPLSIREIPDRKAKATNYIEDEDEYYPGATRTSTRSRKQVSYEISSDEEEEPEDFVPTSASHRGRKAKSYAELSDSEIGLDTPPSSIASDRGDTPTLAISSVDDDEDDIPLHVLFSRRKTPQKYSEVTLISDSEDERIIIKTNVKSSRTQVDGVQAREWTPRETNIKVRGNRSHTFPNLTPSKTNGKASSNQLSIVQRGTPMVLQTNDDISYVEFIIARRSATAGKLFVSLATEIHQMIANYLPRDKDIGSYRLLCKKTESSITASFWRIRFLGKYDPAEDLAVKELEIEYKERIRMFKKWIVFDLNKYGLRIDRNVRREQEKKQKICLQMLRSLILESNAKKVTDDEGYVTIQGKNFEFIVDLLCGRNGVSQLDIVDALLNTSRDRDQDSTQALGTSAHDKLVYIIQLCLTPFALHPHICNGNTTHFDMSQYQVYRLSKDQPIFLGPWKQEINARLLLHMVNFFKYHLKVKGGEGLLAHAYHDLPLHQIPQPWDGRVKAGTQPLRSHWRAAYTYMDSHDMVELRNWDRDDSLVVTDCLDGGENFQDISMFFDEAKFSDDEWPTAWEHILCSDVFKDVNRQSTHGGRTRGRNIKPVKKPEMKQFWGSCRGSKKGHFFGRIHAMTTQQDIHGFQRLVLMQYFTKQVDGFEVYDPRQVWAYEGCVLPGGRIILGRWWDAKADPTDVNCISGPFIWWNVEESSAAEPINSDQAWDFLDSFQEPSMGVLP